MSQSPNLHHRNNCPKPWDSSCMTKKSRVKPDNKTFHFKNKCRLWVLIIYIYFFLTMPPLQPNLSPKIQPPVCRCRSCSHLPLWLAAESWAGRWLLDPRSVSPCSDYGSLRGSKHQTQLSWVKGDSSSKTILGTLALLMVPHHNWS